VSEDRLGRILTAKAWKSLRFSSTVVMVNNNSSSDPRTLLLQAGKELRTMAIGESTLFLVQPGEDVSDLKRVPLKSVLYVKRRVNTRVLFDDADLDILTKKLPGAKDRNFESQSRVGQQATDANGASQTIDVTYLSEKNKEEKTIEIVAYEKPMSAFHHLRRAWVNVLIRKALRQPLRFTVKDDESGMIKCVQTLYNQIEYEILNEKDIQKSVELLNELTEAMHFDRELKGCFAHSKLLPAFVLRKLIDYARKKTLLNSTELLHVYHLLLTTHAAMFNSECVRNMSELVCIFVVVVEYIFVHTHTHTLSLSLAHTHTHTYTGTFRGRQFDLRCSYNRFLWYKIIGS